MRVIFVFSAPRSGSTLVQRVLAAHSQVTTTSEPWLLLPLLAPLCRELPAPGPRDPLIAEALEDFVGTLPAGADAYRAAVRNLAVTLYGSAGDRGATHFVDKTPLYHLIVDEIVRTFPDDRFVFLFRNPLSVIASCVELFDAGRWEVARYHMALFRSLCDLVPASVHHASRSLTVRFEDLVSGQDEPWRRLLDYVGLPWEPDVLRQFADVQLRGRKGDPTGIRRYAELSSDPLQKWRETISNPVRQAWCRRYLLWLGRERLEVMGYDLDLLLGELEEAPAHGGQAWEDAARLGASLVREVAKAHLPRYASRASTWRALLRARAANAVAHR